MFLIVHYVSDTRLRWPMMV